jgi:hypothetical protein
MDKYKRDKDQTLRDIREDGDIPGAESIGYMTSWDSK